MELDKHYMCIDLKSFYASVECVERGLDPLTTNLVVADLSRTEKTICLAVTPSMKALGVKNRCRVFEIPKNIHYIAAVPRMQLYMEYSARIYGIYLRYFAPQDIHVYSIDEVFIDISRYLGTYKESPTGIAKMVMNEILKDTGITSTCGLGSNMYLAKIAMDITAKKTPDHIGILDEHDFKKYLWTHRPLTDFWRIGHGTEARLAKLGIFTMQDIAKAPEELIYKNFGIDGKFLIEHAWGREDTTIEDIKRFVPKSSSLTSGQVLSRGYEKDEGRIIAEEMTDELVLSMVDKGLCTSTATLLISYDGKYMEQEGARGSVTLPLPTSSGKELRASVLGIYDDICDSKQLVRRVTIVFSNVLPMETSQYDIFTDTTEQDKEHELQLAMLHIKKKYGKNSIVKCMDLQKCATMMERNMQIGGHRA